MSKKVDVFSLKGEKIEQISLPLAIVGQKANDKLIAQALRVYLSNQRKAAPRTKTRGEVSGSTRKIWRQKGTGRARHGDRYAPIFVGGGVAHGPKGNQNWQLKMSKKMRKQALFSLLSQKLNQGKIMAALDLGKIEPKTKAAALFLEKITKVKKPKALIIVKTDKKESESVFHSFRNLPKVRVAFSNQLNIYLVLNSNWLIFEKKALDSLEKNWLKNGVK